MPQPIAFKFRQAENRPNYYEGVLPKIDRKRATAVLVRQSRQERIRPTRKAVKHNLGCKTMAGSFMARKIRTCAYMTKGREYPGRSA